ncbi:hypothetical protein LTR36_003088 [Oleoguttula mirabilis]|uniref:F-box domain-containing protein n=1 Tax=Oleoguttula mirabilis TaxID=1507867 RepID=A0AAV9JYF8_9PEZI|nr:hypothetical protein LTR36_003088 [Oleoguttula mirabilis]
MAKPPQQQSTFLALPPELRNRVYKYILADDVELFAESVRKPALLAVCRLIEHEYAGVFYDTNLIKIDAYYSETDSWCEIRAGRAKQVILESATFADLFDFWSLASARRYCQRVCYSRENVQRGIVAISTNAGFRRWQWSVQT